MRNLISLILLCLLIFGVHSEPIVEEILDEVGSSSNAGDKTFGLDDKEFVEFNIKALSEYKVKFGGEFCNKTCNEENLEFCEILTDDDLKNCGAIINNMSEMIESLKKIDKINQSDINNKVQRIVSASIKWVWDISLRLKDESEIEESECEDIKSDDESEPKISSQSPGGLFHTRASCGPKGPTRAEYKRGSLKISDSKTGILKTPWYIEKLDLDNMVIDKLDVSESTYLEDIDISNSVIDEIIFE